MKTVKISEAKNNLSRYLRYVQRGGRVRILDRTTPIADLVPIERGKGEKDDDWDALLDDLARRGLLRRGKGRFPPELSRPGPGRKSDPSIVAELRREREEGR